STVSPAAPGMSLSETTVKVIKILVCRVRKPFKGFGGPRTIVPPGGGVELTRVIPTGALGPLVLGPLSPPPQAAIRITVDESVSLGMVAPTVTRRLRAELGEGQALQPVSLFDGRDGEFYRLERK